MVRASPESLVLAFTEAASALGFTFVPRFSALLPSGTKVQSLGLVREFGAPVGTLVFSIGMGPSQVQLQAIEDAGYFCSIMNAESYSSYVEKHFVDTLNDWGYFGAPQDKPKWYTGDAWC